MGIPTPLSKASSVFPTQAVAGGNGTGGGGRRGVRGREGGKEVSQHYGMTLRSRERTAKRVLEESESEEREMEGEEEEEEEEEGEGEEEEEEEGEEEEGTKRRVSQRRKARARGVAHKRQRLCSSEDDEEENVPSLPQLVTRTSRGRLVKPTSKFI